VFRHFSSKRALLEEVFARRLDALIAYADEQLALDDSRKAFFDVVAAILADAPAKFALDDLLLTVGSRDARARGVAKELRQRFGRLLERAQAAGAVGGDVSSDEAWALVVASARASSGLEPSSAVRLGELVSKGVAERGHKACNAGVTRAEFVSAILRSVTTYQGDAWTALGDRTRRAIFERLVERPRPVGEIARELPVSRPAVSQHLRVLKDAGLVIDQPVGNRRVYRVDPEGLAALRSQLESFWTTSLANYKQIVEQSTEEKK
jgi:DNA-binding transcriptional ArsR family regulator/AcrR family transcriptional regulator